MSPSLLQSHGLADEAAHLGRNHAGPQQARLGRSIDHCSNHPDTLAGRRSSRRHFDKGC